MCAAVICVSSPCTGPIQIGFIYRHVFCVYGVKLPLNETETLNVWFCLQTTDATSLDYMSYYWTGFLLTISSIIVCVGIGPGDALLPLLKCLQNLFLESLLPVPDKLLIEYTIMFGKKLSKKVDRNGTYK